MTFTARGQPWERQEWDTEYSWACFHDHYLAQRSPRFVEAAYDSYVQAKYSRKPKYISKRCRQWANAQDCQNVSLPGAWTWVQRAGAWDDHLAALDVALWEERRLKERNEEWDMSTKLKEKVQQMLLFPLARTERTTDVSPDGMVTSVTAVYPTRWNMSHVASFANAAVQIARLALGMETERKAVEVDLERVLATLPDEFREAVCQELIGQVWGGGNVEGAGQ